jgi:hypothetical protein
LKVSATARPITTAPAALPVAEGPDPLRHTTTGQREREQRNCRPDGEGHGQRDGLATDLPGGAGHRDGRQNRSGTGNVDRAEGEPEHKSAVLGADPALRDPGKRLLQQRLHPREHHRHAEQHQHDQAGPPDGVLGQRQRAQ